MSHRAVCLECRRPATVCYCALLPNIPTRTRVVFLQHPRERRMPVNTARIAHLSLPNSELHEGVVFEDRPELDADAVVLFPAPGARDVSELPRPPKTLVVIDGTWPQAKKVLKRNPRLMQLPQVRFTPKRPGNYRIRREPAAHCVSTVEAVVEALGQLEGPPERYAPMLGAFERMIDWQIEHAARREGPSRHKRRVAGVRPVVPQRLLERAFDVVLFYAEANAYPSEDAPYPPELVHLVAVRPASQERFEALIAPRHPLCPSTPHHLALPEAEILRGEGAAAALRRWRDFLRPKDQLLTWGYFGQGLLASEGETLTGVTDLRVLAARKVRGRPGDLDTAPAKLGAAVGTPLGAGRAGRRLSALSAVWSSLLADPRPVQRPR